MGKLAADFDYVATESLVALPERQLKQLSFGLPKGEFALPAIRKLPSVVATHPLDWLAKIAHNSEKFETHNWRSPLVLGKER